MDNRNVPESIKNFSWNLYCWRCYEKGRLKPLRHPWFDDEIKETFGLKALRKRVSFAIVVCDEKAKKQIETGIKSWVIVYMHACPQKRFRRIKIRCCYMCDCLHFKLGNIIPLILRSLIEEIHSWSQSFHSILSVFLSSSNWKFVFFEKTHQKLIR